MTSISMTPDKTPSSEGQSHQMPVPVQIISTLMFGGFSIAVVAIAFAKYWPAGVLLAIVLGWRGGFAPGSWSQSAAPSATQIMALTPEAEGRSGNASFDAYREDTLSRLEQEQDKFENFLSRLREAKDKSEFDDFMDTRARRMIQDRTRAPQDH